MVIDNQAPLPEEVGHTTIKSALLFFISLLVTWSFFYLAPVQVNLIKPLAVVLCEQVTFLINLLGIDVYQNGTSIWGDHFSINVGIECNAVYEINLLICGIFAFPAETKYKIKGVVGAFLIVYLFNLIRIVVLFRVGMYDIKIFQIIHDHISQSIFLFLLVILWLFWVTGVKKQAHKK